MTISLVLATVDRIKEVKRFLDALDRQTHRDFELIVVDQNHEGTLAPLLDNYKDNFSIVHIPRPNDRGVSKSRNTGIENATGEILTFPDDDCWYPPELLGIVDVFMRSNPDVDSVSGRMAFQEEKSKTFSKNQGYFLESPLKVAKVPGPWSLFLRRRAWQHTENFDENLGPGAGTAWGAGEDTDYYLKIYEAGFNFFYNPEIVVYHPVATQYFEDRSDLTRPYRYGVGRARVWKRHNLPLWYFIYEISRSGAGTVISFLLGQRNKAIWHRYAFLGKIRGWFSK